MIGLLERVEQESGQTTSSLRKAMATNDIREFVAGTVATHKKRVKRQLELMNYLTLWGLALTALFSLTGLISLVMMAVDAGSRSQWGGFALGASLIGAFICWQFIRRLGMPFPTGIVRWELTPLTNYLEPIPGFAWQTVADIRKECPEVQFFVEHITNDPFLVVIDPETDALLHIEFWNEPGFNQQRVV